MHFTGNLRATNALAFHILKEISDHSAVYMELFITKKEVIPKVMYNYKTVNEHQLNSVFEALFSEYEVNFWVHSIEGNWVSLKKRFWT